MLFEVIKCETKGEGWKVLGLLDMHKEAFENVNMNEKDREGKVQWPNFSQIDAGTKFEGNIWKGPTGRISVFPPKPQASATPRTGGAPGIKAAQERKEIAIGKAQENKNEAIMVAAAFRDATLILNEFYPDLANETDMDVRLSSLMEMHKRIKDRYIKEWHETEKSLDVPF